jgi:cell division protein FtsB
MGTCRICQQEGTQDQQFCCNCGYPLATFSPTLGELFQAFQEVLSQRERWEQKIWQKYEQLQQQYAEPFHKYQRSQQKFDNQQEVNNNQSLQQQNVELKRENNRLQGQLESQGQFQKLQQPSFGKLFVRSPKSQCCQLEEKSQPYQQLQQQVGQLQHEIAYLQQEIARLHQKLDSQSQFQQQEDVFPESAVGYDYTRLQDLLANQKWRQADEETAKAMLKVSGREKEGCLRAEDIENFPCEDLQTIDRLWVESSNGKFGFSVQREIYQSLGGDDDYETVKKFADTVGWRKDGKWKSYGELCFYGNCQPAGHLPGVGRVCLCWVLLWLFVLFSRTEACNL